MEVNIVMLEGKPIKKLIGVVSDAIGTLYKPRAIRNEADAEAYKIGTIAEAQAKATLIQDDAELELIERAKRRLVTQELKRQENIEQIAEKSISHFAEQASENPINNDWSARFFERAQNISEDKMQEIWA
jgi:hypothetical protein